MRLAHPDGTRLGATLVRGTEEKWVVIGGATGVPHRYYHALSVWLAKNHGVNVLSFDYRGIGDSRRGSLRGSLADFRAWASDLGVAIRYAADRGPVVVVGHSFGGHAFGMTEFHGLTRGLYTFATGAGWHGYMTHKESLRAQFLWHCVAPPLVSWKGYLPSRLLGLGEDLPAGVYRDWKRWCGFPQYFFDDPTVDFSDRFAQVQVPVVGVNSIDDAWAPPVSARVFLSHYPRFSPVVVTPRQLGVRSIGHMSYVRPACQGLWFDLGQWIDARFAQTSKL